MAKPAHLYVITDGSGAHKVGLSISPEKRLRQLQTGSPRRLTLVRASETPFDEPVEVEAYAHWLLREALELGEWFNVTADAAWVALVAAADAVARGERAPGRGHESTPREWTYWQLRAKAAGLSQADLARLCGCQENTISNGLRGLGQRGVPIYLRSIIRLWEISDPRQREAVLRNPDSAPLV